MVVLCKLHLYSIGQYFCKIKIQSVWGFLPIECDKMMWYVVCRFDIIITTTVVIQSYSIPCIAAFANMLDIVVD